VWALQVSAQQLRSYCCGVQQLQHWLQHEYWLCCKHERRLNDGVCTCTLAAYLLTQSKCFGC
jgi:hypothetical protein